MPRLRLSGVVVLCCLFTIFTVAVKPATDPDLWWHLASGRYMSLTHGIPHHDVFSLTATHHVWIMHEWLTELLLYAGWTVGGARLLSLASATVISLTFLLVFLAARERGAPPLPSAVLVLLGALASAPTWGTRPQMLSLLFTAAFGLAIARMVMRGQTAPPLWMAAAMLLWVNVHGGFIFGLALLVLASSAHLLQDRWPWLSPRLDERPPEPRGGPKVRAGRSAAVMAAAIGATLCNPNGLAGALYPFSYLGNNASTRYIAEWESPDFHQTQYLLFAALIVVLLAAALAAPRQARLADLAIVLPFLVLALQSVRNISLYAVLVTPITAEVVAGALPTRWRGQRAAPRPAPARSRLNWLTAAIIGAVILASAGGQLTASAQARAESKRYPVQALAYIASHRIPARGFNSYNWGGFLIWHWAPRRSVFVDGRADMYGDAFMDRYIRAYRGDDSWLELFRLNRLCYALLEPSTGLARVLRSAPGWTLVYHDPVSNLFVSHDRRAGCP